MIYEKRGVGEILGVPEKTHFLNCCFAKPGLMVHGLPLPVDCLTSGRLHTLKAGFAKRQFRKCVFSGTPCISSTPPFS